MLSSILICPTISNSSPKASKANSKQAKIIFISGSFLVFISTFSGAPLYYTLAVMAFRSMSYLRSLMGRLRGSATYATSTTPKMKAYAPTDGHFHDHQSSSTTKTLKGDFVPVYVAIGMIFLSVSLGLHTAKQQVMYSPAVRLKKKLRETLPEVEYPDKVVDEADKFFRKSFFRKVAHVQEFDYGDHAIPDPIRKDAFAHKPHAETLKDVGVDPKLH